MGFLSKIGRSITSSTKGMFGNISKSASSTWSGLTGQISKNFSLKNLGNMGSNILEGIFNKTLSSFKDGMTQGLMKGISGSTGIPGLISGESGDFYMQDYIYTLIANRMFDLNSYSTFSDAYTVNDKLKIGSNKLAHNNAKLPGLNLEL